MVKMNPMVLSSTCPNLIRTPPTDTTAAAATVLHLNFALPMAMESMVTPTGRSEPVMA